MTDKKNIPNIVMFRCEDCGILKEYPIKNHKAPVSYSKGRISCGGVFYEVEYRAIYARIAIVPWET